MVVVVKLAVVNLAASLAAIITCFDIVIVVLVIVLARSATVVTYLVPKETNAILLEVNEDYVVTAQNISSKIRLLLPHVYSVLFYTIISSVLPFVDKQLQSLRTNIQNVTRTSVGI